MRLKNEINIYCEGGVVVITRVTKSFVVHCWHCGTNPHTPGGTLEQYKAHSATASAYACGVVTACGGVVTVVIGGLAGAGGGVIMVMHPLQSGTVDQTATGIVAQNSAHPSSPRLLTVCCCASASLLPARMRHKTPIMA